LFCALFMVMLKYLVAPKSNNLKAFVDVLIDFKPTIDSKQNIVKLNIFKLVDIAKHKFVGW